MNRRLGPDRGRRIDDPIRLVLIGENRVFLDALAERLDDFPDLVVVGCIPPSAVQGTTDAVDVAVVDIDGPEERTSMLRQTRAVRATWVLALLDDLDPRRVTRALRHGATAFASKSAPARDLADTIRQVGQGRLTVSLELLSAVVVEAIDLERSERELRARFESLSERERAVLAGLLSGENAAQIAAHLFVSSNTVRTHTRHIFDKLGVRSQVEAIALSLKTGFATRGNGIESERAT